MIDKTLRDIPLTPLHCMAPEDAVRDAVRIMHDKSVSCIVVMRGEVPAGLFSERHLLSALSGGGDILDGPLEKAMGEAITAPSSAGLLEAYHLMDKHRARNLVVVDPEGAAAGLVSLTDLVEAVGEEFFLGARKVSDVMNRIVVTAPSSGMVRDFAGLMEEKGISCLVVVKDRRRTSDAPAPLLQGVVTARDLVRILNSGRDLDGLTLQQVMSSPVITVSPDSPLSEATDIMREHNVRRLAAADEHGALHGLLTQGDIVRGLKGEYIETLRKMLDRLERSEAKHRGIFQNAVEGIFQLGLDGRMTNANPALARLHGFQTPELLLQSFRDDERQQFIHSEDSRRFFNTLATRGEVHNFEARLRRGDNTSFWGSLSARVVRSPMGELEHIEGYVVDRTEQRLAEIALEQAKAAAEEANEAKNEFLALMSHEIRTPLNAILGMTDLLAESRLDNEQQLYLEVARNSGENLLVVINDILDMSRLEQDGVELESVRFNLRELVERACASLSVHSREKSLELSCLVDWDVPSHVLGDPNRLRQILYNLISNAIKFTTHGEVRVRVQKDNRPTEANQILFTVVDTGVGIPRDKQQRIFDSFVQADASPTRKYAGVGLGLSISKRLVDQMGGRIWVISEPGKGSSFFFTVRLPQPDAGNVDLPIGALEGLKALVVDDNPTNRLLLSEQLSNWGLTVAEAESGPLGLQMLLDAADNGGRPFDLLLLDCRMPDIDGFETAQRIRADKRLASLPVLMLTSDARPGQNLRASRLGLQGCLTKPVRNDILRDRLLEIAASLTPPQGGPAASLGSLSILLAEDDPANQHVLSSTLNALNCRVEAVGNGLAAVERTMYKRYDAVILDLHMPGMDGLEAARTIREWEEEQGLEPMPIIALSADVVPKIRQEALDAGCNAFLCKPAKRADLQQVLGSLVN